MNPKSYVSFSIWGTQLKYLAGALANAELAKIHFPNWQSVFYCGSSITKAFKLELENLGALTVDCRDEVKIPPSMWRYLAADIPDCQRFISRDCDSRLSARDKSFVDSWEASGKAVHIIQDHSGHKNTLLAGMWGCVPSFFKTSFRGLMEKYGAGNNSYGVDQNFLKHVLWPKAQMSVFYSKDLTEKLEYVGQVFDENNDPVPWVHPVWDPWVKPKVNDEE